MELKELALIVIFSIIVFSVGFIVLYKLCEFLRWLRVYQYRKIKYKHYIRLSDKWKDELDIMVYFKEQEKAQREREKEYTRRKNKWGF